MGLQESRPGEVSASQVGLDNTDKLLLNALQTDFPLTLRPFDVIASRLGISADEVIDRTRRLRESGLIRQISAIFDSHALGYSSSLVAMKVDPAKLDETAAKVNKHPGVSHNYAREHSYNLWFTITTPAGVDLQTEIDNLAVEVGAEGVLPLPTTRLFKIGVNFDMTGSEMQETPGHQKSRVEPTRLTENETKAVRVLQEDLPLEPRPFKRPAERFNMTEDQILDMARHFIQRGIMRRFAATLRHRAAGFQANAMGVWVVPEDRTDEVGQTMAGFASVSHCYQRPTYPDWPYSLFTMIHGRTKEDCEDVARQISQATGIADYRLLYSTKEYKKIRVRYFDAVDAE